MNRRRLLATAASGVVAGVAGCLGNNYDGEAANEFDYETTTTADVEVPLVPVADAIDWYRNETVVFADARGESAFERAHVDGAVHSPAPDGQSGSDPVEQHSRDSRIVTYCGCPHHLSTLRGAALIGDGYAHTYAIDEGFRAWLDNNYPVAGSDVSADPASYRIVGRTDSEFAGDSAWAWHDPTGQREATPIEEDGRFSMEIHFYDIGLESPIRIETPAGERTEPLRALTDSTVVV